MVVADARLPLHCSPSASFSENDLKSFCEPGAALEGLLRKFVANKRSPTAQSQDLQERLWRTLRQDALNETYRIRAYFSVIVVYFSVIAKEPSQSAGKEAVRKTSIREANRS